MQVRKEAKISEKVMKTHLQSDITCVGESESPRPKVQSLKKTLSTEKFEGKAGPLKKGQLIVRKEAAKVKKEAVKNKKEAVKVKKEAKPDSIASVAFTNTNRSSPTTSIPVVSSSMTVAELKEECNARGW